MNNGAKGVRNQYYREWRAKNKDKVSAINRRYRETHRDAIAQQQARYWERKATESAQQNEVK